MSKAKRRKFSPALKAKVCLEVLREEASIGEVASKYQVHANVIRSWKKLFCENASVVFETEKEKNPAEEREPELYQQIGQMKVENDFLKKKLGLLGVI